MPTRKQRRRRAKEQRHEYVWEDEEGNELDSSEMADRKTDSATSRPRATGSRRQPQPPSWRRTFRRGLIFVPIMFVVISLLSKNLSLADRIIQTVLIAAVFVPFSYFLDGLFWRSYQRRMDRASRSNGRRGS